MYILNHLRPLTLAQLIGEMIADHADETEDDGFDFHTEEAAQIYRDLLAAGINNCGEDEFFGMIEVAVDIELGRKETEQR